MPDNEKEALPDLMEGVSASTTSKSHTAAARPAPAVRKDGPMGLPQKPMEHFGSSGVAPGWTKHAQIHEAAQEGNIQQVEQLLANGVDVNIKAAVSGVGERGRMGVCERLAGC